MSAVTPGMRPLDIETGDEALDERLQDALFLPSTDTLRIGSTSPRTLSFRYADGQIEAEKTLTFQPAGLVSITVESPLGGQPVPRRLRVGTGARKPVGGGEERPRLRGAEGRGSRRGRR